MPRDYDPSAVELKWQKRWDEAKVYNIDLQKAKNPYYSLVMFPYPSGDKLHVGHWYNFAPADSWSRFTKMQGRDVFAPMGFDAFGLPAENYAIKTGIHPSKSIHDNVQTMIAQLKRMGCMYDWDAMVNTSLPDYYRWTQWVFLQMYGHGLAYKKLGNVNYCPKDQTVLANEQVWEGKCERCGTEVIQKPLEQWYWKITNYSQKLLDNLDSLDWPQKTKIMQRNWIGRSEGTEVIFEVPVAHNRPVNRGFKPPVNRRVIHLTFVTHNRHEAFADEQSASDILSILRDVAARHDIVLHEASAMYGHGHLLVEFERSRHLENDIVHTLKGASAREYLKRMEGEQAHLWASGKHYEDIASASQYENTLRYIRDNPAKSDISSNGRILSDLSYSLRVFTTRPDTLFGVTYMVLAPNHPLVEIITTPEHQGSVKAYREQTRKKTELQRTDLNKEKSGVPTGAFAVNPVNHKKIPIWIGDYVLMSYGTGAIMAVPGHDERDHEFATAFDLPIGDVVEG